MKTGYPSRSESGSLTLDPRSAHDSRRIAGVVMSRYVPPIFGARNLGKPEAETWQFGPPPWHDFRPPPISAGTSWGARGPARNRDGGVASALSRARSEPSQVVDPRTREAAENVTGADLDDVRVHSGPASEAAAAALD